MGANCSVEIRGLWSILVGKAAALGRRGASGRARIDWQVEATERDIRARVLAILSGGRLLEIRLGRLRAFALCGLGHRARGRLGDRGLRAGCTFMIVSPWEIFTRLSRIRRISGRLRETGGAADFGYPTATGMIGV